MRVLIFGATGMVGSGALLECLRASDVNEVLIVVRRPSGHADPRVREIRHDNLLDLSPIADQLTNIDACIFAVGVTSAGVSEAEYRRATYDTAVHAGQTLAAKSPQAACIFVSGAGTNSGSRIMWARVKGQAEDALLAMPFRAVFAVRPSIIQPLDGIRSRTGIYNLFYALARPMLPVLTRFPRYVTTTRVLGRAMLKLARDGSGRRVIESREINQLGA